MTASGPGRPKGRARAAPFPPWNLEVPECGYCTAPGPAGRAHTSQGDHGTDGPTACPMRTSDFRQHRTEDVPEIPQRQR